MGCGCGGNGATAAAIAAQAAPPNPGEHWEWVPPSGKTQRFEHKRQAEHAAAMAGGRVRRVTSSSGAKDQDGPASSA